MYIYICKHVGKGSFLAEIRSIAAALKFLEAKVFLILGRFFGLFPNEIKVPSFLSLVLQPQLLWEHYPCLYSHFIGYVGRGGSTQC